MPRDHRYGLTPGGISRHTPVYPDGELKNKKGRFIFYNEAAFLHDEERIGILSCNISLWPHSLNSFVTMI